MARDIHGFLLFIAMFAWLVFLPTTGLLYLLGALQ
jgi:hypothetical protein